MIRVLSPARRGTAALIVAACAVALTASAALAQGAPEVSVNPSNGPAGSSTTLTISNFDFLSQCNPQAPTEATCIYVKFTQGTRPPVTIAVASGSNSSPVRIPAACTAPANTNCADPGSATITAHSPNGQNATTGFTVSGTPPAPTTTAAGATTTTASSTTSSSTSSSSSSTTVTTVVVPSATTTTTIATKKSSSSHSDVPRYIAVALVVLAAAATAGVDTRLRHMKPPPPGA